MYAPGHPRAGGRRALLHLAAERRINGTAEGAPAEHGLGQTDITADAAIDGVPPVLRGLEGEVRVGQQLAPDPQQVDRAVCHHLQRDGRVVDAGAPEQRYTEPLAHPPVEVGPLASRAVQGLGPEIGFDILGDRSRAEREVQHIDARVFQLGRNSVAHLRRVQAARGPLVQAEAEEERYLQADNRAEPAHDHRGDPRRFAILIGAVVIQGGQEARQRPAVRALDIDRVEPGAQRPLGPAGILLHHGLERRQGELVEPIGEVRVPSVGDLESRSRSRLVDRVDQQAKGGNLLVAVEAE